MYVSLYETYLKMQESYTFYYAPQMENYLDLETRFENLSRLKLMAGRAQYQEGSGTAEELVWDTLDSFKLDYGNIREGAPMRPIREAIQKKRAASSSMGLRLLLYWFTMVLLMAAILSTLMATGVLSHPAHQLSGTLDIQ